MFDTLSKWAANNKSAIVLICIGLFIQLLYLMQPSSNLLWYDTISLISGFLGVFAVVLCSNRKLISYAFGIAQILTFLVIVWHDALYAKIVENIFYLITMIIGFFIWNNHYDNDKVETKHLSSKMLIILIMVTAVLSFIIGYGLSFTNDTHPYIDAFTTLPSFVAQILMILRYREQWIFWILIDIGCIWLWMSVGNNAMIAQYIFWTINCIYGWKNWK